MAQTENSALKAELAEREKQIRVLTSELDPYRVSELGNDELRCELEGDKARIRTLESQVNEHMAKAEELKREVYALRKELCR